MHHTYSRMLKKLDRASKVAWCPSKKGDNLLASGTPCTYMRLGHTEKEADFVCMAAGTIAGTIDGNFETRSQLEVHTT
jgi:hypothetical protein